MPLGFQDAVAISGLTYPTAVRFAPDGRVLVTEKGGVLKVFDGLNDPTPTIAADLSAEVDDYWDRGLLGIALDPNFSSNHFVYLLYTYDAPPGKTAPVWNDACPTPPGPNSDGCVVSGRLVRIQIGPDDTEVGSPTVLISDQWCQQFPSHSIGDLAFGPDGELYVSGGEGASFDNADYGQFGGDLSGTPTQRNPCGDPPAGAGGTESPPSAAGGALRAQSARRVGGPALLNGALLRLDPATGQGAAGNPQASSSDANLRRIVAYGFRNPFRFAFRPNTSDLWLGDVGWNDWEEIERIPTGSASMLNFGWPCYEGPNPQPAYQSAGLAMCSSLAAGSVTAPYFTYPHDDEVALDDGCLTTHGSVVSGLGFYNGTAYPAPYPGALVFADHSRECIWAMPLGANGQPDTSQVQPLETDAANPVDIQAGPNGDLFYVDFDGGTIRRLSYVGSGHCAAGTFTADYFDNSTLSGSPVFSRCENAINHDWEGGPPGPGVGRDGFSVRWTGQPHFAAGTYTFTSTSDDGIRVYVDGTKRIDDWAAHSSHTTTAQVTLTAGTHTVTVEYYEGTGDALAQVSWTTPNHAPTPVIDAPRSGDTYAVGDTISFSGSATADQGTPTLSWQLKVHHCTTPTTCHVHNVQQWSGPSGSFTAPDHEYPSHIELVLTAKDADGLTGSTSVTLNPKTVALSFATDPTGLSLSIGSGSNSAPFTRTVIVKSVNSISAPATQVLGGVTYAFSSWSDGGAATHTITAPGSAATFTARYTPTTTAPPPVLPPLSVHAPSLSGAARVGGTLTVDAGSWSGSSPVALAYTWLRCRSRCAVVTGTSSAQYRVSAADIGSRIEARVTATNAMGSSTATTNASQVVPRVVRGRIHALRRVPAPPRPRARRP